ncbi:MAG: AAA family ATPase [Coleofasciculaceae cyanobacterium]
MMLVSGYSGIGKSALVQEIYKPITKRRGYFISGKFDQFGRNIPYSSISSAFSNLVRQLLTETEASLAQWREKIKQAFGINGQVIIDVIPELEMIVGKQPQVPELAASEAQNRFNLIFQNFIKVFTQPEHPLVMFIDDLQWADVASLKLIKLLMSAPDSQYLFLIGAYRDNEVNPTHPLMLTVDEIRESGVTVEQIYLPPLDSFDVNQLISDTLKCPANETIYLAELVLLKTDGNPFFIQEFLKSLYSENLLKFDFTSLGKSNQGKWQWNLEEIKAKGITDNVVELMADKIQKLSASAQRILQLAAAIGNQFDLKTLAIVYEKSQKETASDLQEAIAINLILPLSDDYKLIEVDIIDSSLEINQKLMIEYKFVHDRVQQAAYSLILSKDKQAVHWKIGQLLQSTPYQIQEQKIFDIVKQLNLGIELIIVESKREQLAQLNLVAGKKAKASAAYEAAWNYLKVGISCLSVDSWKMQYDLTLALYVEATEAASLSGNVEDMEQLISIVLQQGKTLLDKVKVYEIKIQNFMAYNKTLEAIEIALSVLKMLGINFPKKPNKLDILLALARTKFGLAGKQIEALINLPEMTAPDKIAAIHILSLICSAAYFVSPELLPLIVFKQVSLSIKYGNTSVSSYAYATYGLILSGEIVGDIHSGYQFGQLALSLVDKFNAKKLQSKTIFIVNYFLIHWHDHLKETLSSFLEAYLIGLETGDLEYATYSVSAYSYYSLVMGKELTKLERDMAMYSNTFRQLNQETLFYYNQLQRQVVLNLMDQAEDKCRLVGESYDEIKMLPIHLAAKTQNICHSIYFFKLYLGYLFQNYQQALENAALVEKHIKSAVGAVPLSHFYNSLTHLAIYFDVSKSEQKRILKKVKVNQKKIKKWASSAPMNHLHKFYLVEAELYRVLGHQVKAIDCYDQAIALAKEYKYLNDEALAHELAAKFYLALGKMKIAQVYMLDARYCYRQWGAIAKVKDLEKRYPQLFFKKFDSLATQLRVSESNSGERSEVLDLATVMKATQVFSSEIRLDKLLTKLMEIMIENAGAQKGFLILEQAGKLLIEAEGTKEDGITVLQSVPIVPVDVYHSTSLLSSAIINYVARTKESVVLNDATHEGQFIKDSYIIQNQPKSILCVPLINQDKLISIVYLENNLTTAAFPPYRLEVIKLLSAQAAIAIVNAKLYLEVKESESKLTQFNEALSRFVPGQFLQALEKESIVDVKLGDSVQKEMSVLFSDIRDFTTLSESMTPEDNFKFINAYLSRMEPAIIAHQGFIDKYIGDATMALFSGSADDAVRAGIAMLHELSKYNQHRLNSGYKSIQIGIGINTGSLMLGTVGGQNRMDSTVISDAVNLASRIEGLTKKYGASLLISHHTFTQLEDMNQYAFRIIDRVHVKGKSTEVSVYEVFDADPPNVREAKLSTKTAFEQALLLYNLHLFQEAAIRFAEVLSLNSEDRAAQIYLDRCQEIKLGDINSRELDKFIQFKSTRNSVEELAKIQPFPRV